MFRAVLGQTACRSVSVRTEVSVTGSPDSVCVEQDGSVSAVRKVAHTRAQSTSATWMFLKFHFLSVAQNSYILMMMMMMITVTTTIIIGLGFPHTLKSS